MEQLAAIREEMNAFREDLQELRSTKDQETGRKHALQLVGAGLLGVATFLGSVITVFLNWDKIFHHGGSVGN